MITPTKHMSPDRSLIYVGGEVLSLLDQPRTISSAWHAIGELRRGRGERTRFAFDWYILALDLLYMIDAVDFQNGELSKRAR